MRISAEIRENGTGRIEIAAVFNKTPVQIFVAYAQGAEVLSLALKVPEGQEIAIEELTPAGKFKRHLAMINEE